MLGAHNRSHRSGHVQRLPRIVKPAIKLTNLHETEVASKDYAQAALALQDRDGLVKTSFALQNSQ